MNIPLRPGTVWRGPVTSHRPAGPVLRASSRASALAALAAGTLALALPPASAAGSGLAGQAPALSAAAHAPGDYYGSAVAIFGSVAVAGAPGTHGGRGSVYVFVRAQGKWRLRQTLADPGGARDDEFGFSLALSSTTMVVGAPFARKLAGETYVFTRSAGRWHLQARLTEPSLYFGYSVAVSGSTVLIGAEGENTAAGAAYVFTRGTGSIWSKRARIADPGRASYDYFGDAVALAGGIAVIGAPRVNAQGRAYVYARAGTSWHRAAVLAHRGAAKDGFGSSVAVTITRTVATAVVGAPGGRTGTGTAYIFAHRPGGPWTRKARLAGPSPSLGDELGSSVAIAGSRVLVGASAKGLRRCGTAYEFVPSTTSWRERARVINPGCALRDFFGEAVALWRTTAVIGAPGVDQRAGRAYVIPLL